MALPNLRAFSSVLILPELLVVLNASVYDHFFKLAHIRITGKALENDC